MHKIFLLLSLTIFALTVFAVTNPNASKRPTKIQEITADIEYELETGAILDFLRKCNAKILKGRKDEKALATMTYASYSSQINIWLKYRWFIADTGLSRKWLKSVQGLLLYMRKTQGYIKVSIYNRDTKNAKFKQAVKYLDVAYGRFAKLVKKPVKASLKSVRKAKLKKALWQKAMRKKYKIKENIQSEEF